MCKGQLVSEYNSNSLYVKKKSKKTWDFGPSMLSTPRSKQSHLFAVVAKGQLISKCPFGVFKSPKKPTIFFKDFCSRYVLSLKRSQIKK